MWPQTFLSVSTWIYFPTGPACQRNSSLDPRGKALQHLVIIASSTIECTETRFDHSETIHLIKQANMSKCLCFFLHLNCAYINITASILLQKGALEPKSPVHRMNPALLLRASQKEPSFKQAHLFTKSVFSNHPYWVHFTDQALWSVLHSVSFNLYNSFQWEAVFSSLFYIWENWGLEKLYAFPKSHSYHMVVPGLESKQSSSRILLNSVILCII